MGLFDNLEYFRQFAETDVQDEVLEVYIGDAERAVVEMYGPHFDDITPPRTVLLRGGYNYLIGVPSGTISAIREGSTTLTLDTHYQVFGWQYQRLPAGSNWADLVEVDYTPVDDSEERKRVVAQLVKLALEYTGLQNESVGDYSASGFNVAFGGYASERARILNSLGPPVVIA